MANYFVTIKAAIVTVLEGITQIRNVYNYIEVKPGGYPNAMVTARESQSEFIDTARNRETFIFNIQLQQERVEAGASEAERILTALVDQVIAAFDSTANDNLANTSIFAKPIQTKWGYLAAPDIDVRVVDITLEAVNAQ